MRFAKNIGCKGCVAPMIESSYALHKFISSVYVNSFNFKNLFVIDFKQAYENIKDILNSSDASHLYGIVLGRTDFIQSFGYTKYDNTTLNLNDDSINNHSFIIHPGQTRAQGSVFTRTNLKNALIYVNKKHNVDVKMNSSNYITKIESIEQLLKVYRPSSKVTKNNKVATFSTPNVSIEYKQ